MANKEVYDRWRRGIVSESKKMSQTPIMRIEEGTTNIVLLPLLGLETEMPYQVSFTHKFQDGDDDVFMTCNELTTSYATPCVTCKGKRILVATGDDNDAADAEILKPYPRGFFLCGNYDSPADPAQAIGFGLRTIEQDIGKLVDKYGQFWDPDDSLIFSFERVGKKKKDTRYFGFACSDEHGIGLKKIFGAERAKKLMDSRFPLTRVFQKADQKEMLDYTLGMIDWDRKRLGRLEIDEEPTRKAITKDKDIEKDKDKDKDERPSRKKDDDDRPSRKDKEKDEDERPSRKDKDEDERPSRKRDDDDDKPSRRGRDDDDDRSSRKKDDEDEKPARRGKDDDDDKPSRRGRDDDDDKDKRRGKDDDDDRPSRKRDDDDDKPARRKDKDEEDEKPSRRGRDDDDEKPARRKDKDEDDEKPSRKDKDEDSPRPKPKDKDDDKKSGKAKDEEGEAEVEAMIEKRRRDRQASREKDKDKD